jgi:hypothetical protein
VTTVNAGTSASGWTRLAAIVARSASKLLKLWTGSPASLCLVATFLSARAPRCGDGQDGCPSRCHVALIELILFRAAHRKLLAERIVLPGENVLARLVGRVRERATRRL